MKKILIMGLSETGKTTLAKELYNLLLENRKTCLWFNADDVRKKYDDWDFSSEGRIRQANRMKNLAESNNKYDFIICDFIAPLNLHRDIFHADYIIWLDTEINSKYNDTDHLFEIPVNYTLRINEKDAIKWSKIIFNTLLSDSYLSYTI